VANTNLAYTTLTIGTNGSLTVSGAVTITANLVTQGPASSVLLAAVNPTTFTLNGNYDAYNTGGVSAMTTTGASTHGRSITVNGQVTSILPVPPSGRMFLTWMRSRSTIRATLPWKFSRRTRERAEGSGSMIHPYSAREFREP